MKQKSGFEFDTLLHSRLIPQEETIARQPHYKTFFIGLPRENSLQENRISLTPESVSLLTNLGHKVWVETKGGEGCKYTDKEYSEAGAKIVSSPSEVYQADIILKIEPPTRDELEYFRAGQILISALHQGSLSADYIKKVRKKRITAFAYEFIEDKTGRIPIMRAMSEIAGNMVMFIAAEYLSSIQGKGVLLGSVAGVSPTQAVIIGAGSAAEHAARTALALGVEIQVFDNNLYRLHRLRQTIGCHFFTSTTDTHLLREKLKTADVVIGALRLDKEQHYVVSEDMVAQMKPDSVIIDLSIDQGGCIATSRTTSHDNPVFRCYDVIHYCVPNIPSRVARTATISLSNIFTPILLRAAEGGGIEQYILSNRWFMNGIYVYKSTLTNKTVGTRLKMDYKDIELLLTPRF